MSVASRVALLQFDEEKFMLRTKANAEQPAGNIVSKALEGRFGSTRPRPGNAYMLCDHNHRLIGSDSTILTTRA
jgi:hypothetical protein